MQQKHQDLLDMLLDVVKTKYTDDISVMFIYGSCVNGTSHSKSDLDIIFIPKTKRGRSFSKTFILDGVGYDLWGANWGTLERFANFDDMKVSVLAESQLVYSASDADRQKYEALKQKANAIENGTLTRELYDKAEEHLKQAEPYYDELDRTQSLVAVGGILMELCNTVCLLNHTYLHFGCKQVARELAALEHLPENFVPMFTAVIEQTATAKETCAALIKKTKAFLQDIQKDLPPAAPGLPKPTRLLSRFRKKTEQFLRRRKHKKAPTVSDFAGLYEEISSHWNKIRVSCANGDAAYAFLSAVSLQHTLDCVQNSLGSDDPALRFIKAFDSRSLEQFAMEADKAEAAFLEYLRREGVPIAYYDNLEELRQSF